MKNKRQSEIMNIIREKDVETQEQLLAELKARGFEATQATISRDIKDLRMVKELNDKGRYCYTVSERKDISGTDVRLRNIFKEGVLSGDTAQNIVVIRTMPGVASAACSAIDSMNIPGLVGSLAGDDTGVLIMRDNASAQQFVKEIHLLMK